ncbi:MAG: FprA family A-type flavoprotein, partial [Candidatus Marinimicrobia bacterium]|nr:FprA family A-type flavoprotein [Candidatus Neomarinimicrobiota bacterium]
MSKMATQKLKDGILSLGAKHWDRRIFDELVHLPKGTTYNSFVVQGSDKTALIDTVDPEKTYELIENLKVANVDKIDFIVANHAEQD